MSRARPLLSAELVLGLGLVAAVGIAYLAERWLLPAGPTAIGTAAALAIAATPPALWLLAVRAHEDDLAAARKAVAGVVVLGAFVAAPVARLAIAELAPQNPIALPPLSQAAAVNLVAAILVIGLACELAIYAVVRYTVCAGAPADPLSPMVFTTAAALGFAAHDSYRELASLGAIHLGTGAANAAATPLARAASAAAIGCALIAARHRVATHRARAIVLTCGIVAAAALHGGFDLVRDALAASDLTARPWRSAMITAAAAAVILAALSAVAGTLAPDARSASGRGGGTSV